MIIDGRAIAREILDKTKIRALRLPRPPSFLAIAVQPSPATESYLKMKSRQAQSIGIPMETRLVERATTEELISLLHRATEDAIIVQLPLPDTIDTRRVLDAIPAEKDADVLAAPARESGTILHPVAAAVAEILRRGGLPVAGKRAVVVGNGWLVGAPVAAWLRSAGAQVEVVTHEEGDLVGAVGRADIVVAGAGVPGLIKGEYVKRGSAVIDIGTSELGGSIVGDVCPEVAEVAGIFTPVPGGVGPITVAFLLQNVVTLAERATHI